MRDWRWQVGMLGLLLGLVAGSQALRGESPASPSSPSRISGESKATTTPDQPEAAASEETPRDPALGRKVANFVLPDSRGNVVGLADFAAKPVVLLYWMNTTCPIANLYLPDLIEMQKQTEETGVQVLGIHSDPGLTRDEIASHREKFGINFPVLHDEQQAVASMLGADRTAAVYLLDSQRIVRYHGRVDDRYQYTSKRDEPRRRDVAEAIQELRSGKPVSQPTTEVQGCLITPLERKTPVGEITFAKQVAPILYEKCSECHHPGTAAPFSLLTYDDAVNHGAMIREVVLERRMPPWHADPRHGEFVNDRRLSQDQLETLVAWIDDGMPEGNASETPPAPEYYDGWRIGKPDLVLELPEEVKIPATGVVPYLYFVTPTNFEEDMWIQAAEVRPGNRRAVHHVVLFYRDAKDRGGRPLENWVIGAAPGDTPLEFPEGVGRRIPAGASLIWQMHYTPTGKAETDRSQVAFKFYKKPPTRNVLAKGIANFRFEIPAGAPRHEVKSSYTFPRDAELHALFPHMHLRGHDFEFRAVFPDGQSEILLSVPQYDFNWQTGYRLATPRDLPKGTRIECTAHFDNSAANPANPDPTKAVRWGDQTWEEMMIGYIDYVWKEPAAPQEGPDKTE